MSRRNWRWEMTAEQRAAYYLGRADERRRWAQNLRRWLKEVGLDTNSYKAVWLDSVLEKIAQLAKTPKGK